MLRLRERFIRLVGGTRPYREFTFERYHAMPANQRAFVAAKAFDPSKTNLYLWGPCGVGKTHLAVAILRRWFSRGHSAVMTMPSQLGRRLRMRPPDEEQRVIEEIVQTGVLVLDDLGSGPDSVFARNVLQEILDGRHFRDRGGLVATSSYSMAELARRVGEAVASRLSGMCRVIEVRGPDHRRGFTP